MNSFKYFLWLVCFWPAASLWSQTLSGTVSEMHKGTKNPLPGVNVYWEGTQTGTFTDSKGKFSIEFPSAGHHHLIISFIGYEQMILHMDDHDSHVDVILEQTKTLEETEIISRKSGTHISRLNPIHTQIVTGSELRKAACCNLSESFETNASVDVSYSDAITGAKQIQMLGLAGIYTQMMIENIPSQRGLANPFGLGYVPGSWMESIQISKGTSAVINGYESVTGQINVEYKKPHESERLFVNLYANSDEKTEANVTSAIRLNNKLSTILLTHAQYNNRKIDHNYDGFLDMPLAKQINIANRWLYYDNKHIEWRFGFNILNEERQGGQMDFERNADANTQNSWGFYSTTTRYDVFNKVGILFPDKPDRSIGIIANASAHDNGAKYGLRNYSGEQQSLYTNIIYQDIIGTNRHTLSTGGSFMYDDFRETLADSNMLRTERVPGVFVQYTYNLPEKFTLIGGLRADNHNLFGLFVTPRIHLRYSINQNTIVRATAGKGFRSPAVLAENQHLLTGSRQWIFVEQPKHEEAINAGINLTRYFTIGDRQMTLSTDFYRTEFIHQVMIDPDHSARQIRVYNLDGKSFSNSIQLEINGELIPKLETTFAWRYNDVKMTIDGSLREKPLMSRYKGLVSLSYLFPGNRWKVDFTTQFNGPGRIPSTQENPLQYQRAESFSAYTILLGQITYSFKRLDLYLGGENLGNYKQSHPLIAPSDPFGNFFDASMIWGPVMGRTIYTGMRWKLI